MGHYLVGLRVLDDVHVEFPHHLEKKNTHFPGERLLFPVIFAGKENICNRICSDTTMVASNPVHREWAQLEGQRLGILDCLLMGDRISSIVYGLSR
jgi:hypothetical protein